MSTSVAPTSTRLDPEHVFDWVDAYAEERQRAGLQRQVRPRPVTSTDLDLAGNDYLGLTRDKRVAGAAAAAALRWGAGSTGSRLVTGSTELHTELETLAGGSASAERENDASYQLRVAIHVRVPKANTSVSELASLNRCRATVSIVR